MPRSLWGKFLTKQCLRGLIPNTWAFEITNLKSEKKDLLVSICVSLSSICTNCFYSTVWGGIMVLLCGWRARRHEERRHFKRTSPVCSSGSYLRKRELGRGEGIGRRQEHSPEGSGADADSDVTAARRFRSPAPGRMTYPSVGPDPGSPRPPGAHDRAAPAGEYTSTRIPPAPGTMATDSWALAVDEQEAAAESVSWFQL